MGRSAHRPEDAPPFVASSEPRRSPTTLPDSVSPPAHPFSACQHVTQRPISSNIQTQRHFQSSKHVQVELLWVFYPQFVFKFKFFLSRLRETDFFLHHGPNSGVASVPPKCGRQNIPHLSPLLIITVTLHFHFICCHTVTCSGMFLLMLFRFEMRVSSRAIHCFLPKNFKYNK